MDTPREEGFPEPPGKDPGDRSQDPEPHDALNNPVEDPDPTEYPDPYDRREDPRDEPHPQTGSRSTSEPHPHEDPQAEPTDAPERDRLDD
jgi:hypothetical protein